MLKNKLFTLLLLLSSGALLSQACVCTDQLYLNDIGEDVVHKFAVESTTGALTEIGNPG